MGQLSISEIDVLRQVQLGNDTKQKIFSHSKMSTTTISGGVNRMVNLKLLRFRDKHNKREKPLELTDKGKLALRMLGDLDRIIDD